MPRYLTDSFLDDMVLVVVVIIIGAAIALKGDRSWGWLLVAAAVIWAILLVRPIMGF
jgi:hypothetical protein